MSTTVKLGGADGPEAVTSSGSGSAQSKPVIVTNYMWDQNKEFVKIYIEIEKNYSLDSNDIKIDFRSQRSFSVIFGKFKFNLSNLHADIDSEKSYHKLTKSGKLLIYLKKCSEKEWTSIDVDKYAKQKEEGIPDMMSDPNGFMKIMKQMYDEGDDETKRQIAKSWYETQQERPFDFDPNDVKDVTNDS